MSGLLYKHHTAVSLPTDLYDPKLQPEALNVESNFRLADVHGVGITFHSEYEFSETNINYNYQFKIGEEGTLSTGVGLGLCNVREVIYISDFNVTEKVNSYFNLNLGVAYRLNNFSIGISALNTANQGRRYYYQRIYGDTPLFLIQSAYTHQIGGKFTLKPRILVASDFRSSPSQDDVFGKVNLTAQYDEKFSLGFSYSLTKNLSANIGYDLLDKFRFSYEITTNPNTSDFGAPNLEFTHELSLGYFLK